MDVQAKHHELHEPLNAAITATGSVVHTANDDERRMVRAELQGTHTHAASNGVEVHIWSRGQTFLARGSHRGRRFGVTLGDARRDAEIKLRRVLVDIERGLFERPSEARKHQIKSEPTPVLTLAQLVDRQLADVRRLHGDKTMRDYRARHVPLLEFVAMEANRLRWRYAESIDHTFALEFRKHLFGRMVTGNGRATAKPHRMSVGQIYNVMSAAATLVNWGKKPEIGLLPITLANPFTHEVVGVRPRRDPLAPAPLPLDLRIAMVGVMDKFQLCTLVLPFILPPRPEDLTGLLVNDVIFDRHELMFGTRLGGDDFNKTGLSYRLPWPVQLEPILRCLVAGRSAGPLLRRRTIVDGRRKLAQTVNSPADVVAHFDAALAKSPKDKVQNENDRKVLFRRTLRCLGGMDEEDLAKEFKHVLATVDPGGSLHFYDLRGSVTTGLKNAGVDTLMRMYITGHSLNGHILASYEQQDIHLHLAKYFTQIEPLLTAIVQRAEALRITT